MNRFRTNDIVSVTYTSGSSYGGRITDVARVMETTSKEVKLSGFEHIGWINTDYQISHYFIKHATDEEKVAFESRNTPD